MVVEATVVAIVSMIVERLGLFLAWVLRRKRSGKW